MELTLKAKAKMRDISSVVCQYLKVDLEDVIKIDKHYDVAIARMYCFYILHYHYSFSSQEIALFFNRKRRGVFSIISKAKYLILKQRAYKQTYEDLVSLLPM